MSRFLFSAWRRRFAQLYECYLLYFVLGPESESESEPESESIRSPESELESESEQPYHDSAPLMLSMDWVRPDKSFRTPSRSSRYNA